jgi:hypothetical protein
MSDSEHDDEFEAYLKRRVPIHKGATPPDGIEPPPELDRIIIGNARKAIQGVPPVRHYRAPKWALFVGLAATIIISLVVVLDLGLRAKRQSEIAGIAQEPAASQVVESAPARDVATPAAAAANNSTFVDKLRSDTSTVFRLRPEEARRPSDARHSVAAKQASPPPPKVAERIKVPPIPTVPWPPATTPNTAPDTEADQTVDDKARTRLARAEVAASRSRTDTDAATVPAETYGTAEKPAAEASGMLEEIVVTRQSAPSRQRAGGHPDPAAWLGQIEKLRNGGRTAEAEQEIKHFREVYPAYPVPAEAPSADGRGQ